MKEDDDDIQEYVSSRSKAIYVSSRNKAMEWEHDYKSVLRNNTLEEVAKEFDKMKSLGDTAASFAAYVRNMKK
jgi:hypothetical protein